MVAVPEQTVAEGIWDAIIQGAFDNFFRGANHSASSALSIETITIAEPGFTFTRLVTEFSE